MPETLLSARDLTKVYGSGESATTALHGVEFEVERGEFIAIIGQSGSGKSTLLNLVGLLDSPTSGSLALAGRETGGMSRDERAKLRNGALGFVFQFHHLLPEFTVLENVTMPARIAGTLSPSELTTRALEALGTLGLEDVATKNANQLSGGQKQRVAIARALMMRPPMVLADEPTGNLDTTNTDLVYELFRRINRETGTAFLIVTHDRAVAQRTDRILEIADGALTADIRNPYLARG